MKSKFSRIFTVETYVSVLFTFELVLINSLSDLPTALENWTTKVDQITSLQIPSDNFYGPGAAIMLVPFSWVGESFFAANIVYSFFGAYFYAKIVGKIGHKILRRIAYLGLFSNVYLIWLINSSQDTVFEFFLLMLASYCWISNKYLIGSISLFVLSLTRSAYWLLFLCLAIFEVLKFLKRRKLDFKKILAFPLLLLVAVFNYLNYGSPSPALEGGITAYFSYTQYHYLALPKMDMDVFLSGPNGAFSDRFGQNRNSNLTPTEENREFTSAAIRSIQSNPKETILGWLQKFDSYIFSGQKIPHLPGSYVLNLENRAIEIGDERLSWFLVIGNFLFLLWRSSIFLAGLIAIGIWLTIRDQEDYPGVKLTFLALPWLVGFIPGVLFYTETRFKIVSELLVLPLIVEIYGIYLLKKKNRQELV